jgi:hypothetical protein
VKLIYVNGSAAAETKLRVASGAARALTRQGCTVMPWCPGVAEGDGGARALAVLADACRLFPDEDFARLGAAPPELCTRADLVIALAGAPGGGAQMEVREDAGGLDVMLPGGPAEFPHPFIDPLLPVYPPEVAALPEYRVGVPRYGVMSLPHIAHFSDYALLRAAEWVAAPMPGRFDALFFPRTTNAQSDREWLSLQGLDDWLFTQRAMGCKLYATGDPIAPHTEALPRETLLSAEALSLRLGVRLTPPLPADEVLETLADWWDGSPAAVAMMKWLAGSPEPGVGVG